MAIPFSSGPHSVRPLHHDLAVLGGPTRHGLVSLIDREPNELWTEVRDIVQETGIKTILKKKKCKKAKWLSEEALQIALRRRERKAKEKRKDIPI